jgi:hypothetical protein
VDQSFGSVEVAGAEQKSILRKQVANIKRRQAETQISKETRIYSTKEDCRARRMNMLNHIDARQPLLAAKGTACEVRWKVNACKSHCS